MNQHEKTLAQIEILEIMRDGAYHTFKSYEDADAETTRDARLMNTYAAHLCETYIEDLRGHVNHQ